MGLATMPLVERLTPLPPSSFGPIVVTPAHERLAAHDEDDGAEGADEAAAPDPRDTSRDCETVAIPGLGKRRRRPRAAIIAGAAATAIGCSLLFVVVLRPISNPSLEKTSHASGAIPVEVPTAAPVTTTEQEPVQRPAPPSAAEPTSGATPPAAPAAPAPAATTGTLSTSGAAPGRRIFVDDRTVGETPKAIVVPCGSHRVRVGSRGATAVIDVPCGGEINLGDR
jgi:hypothetical protein